MNISIAIDASRNRSGGARNHLIGILNAIDPTDLGIASVHVWSYRALLDAIPDKHWLIKHSPTLLEASLPIQVWWQYKHLPKEVTRHGCDVLLSTDAGTVCIYRPSVVMSRDMLSFEPGEIGRFGLSFERLRLWLLKHIQIRSLRRATGALFLTNYASNVIQNFTGPLPRVEVIPHGINPSFRREPRTDVLKSSDNIRCVYVSNMDLYKHQWIVIEAVSVLREQGLNVSLALVGGGQGQGRVLTENAKLKYDPTGEFIEILEAVPHHEIPRILDTADIFIFASSCENMPNTLVEAMAAALPIACAARGPMPEVLEDGGVYFDPESSSSIADAIRSLVEDDALRGRVSKRAGELSLKYSWERCASETWDYLIRVATQSSS